MNLSECHIEWKISPVTLKVRLQFEVYHKLDLFTRRGVKIRNIYCIIIKIVHFEYTD